MTLIRRTFFTQSTAITTGFAGLGRFLNADSRVETAGQYGSLVPDRKKIIDLPKGFSYRVLSQAGDAMTDGFRVPGQPDGMGCFEKSRDTVTLIPNHGACFSPDGSHLFVNIQSPGITLAISGPFV